MSVRQMKGTALACMLLPAAAAPASFSTARSSQTPAAQAPAHPQASSGIAGRP